MKNWLELTQSEREAVWKKIDEDFQFQPSIPPFPNGDYYFFLQKDYEWGYLGHPWEKTITIFGKKLIEQFQKIKRTKSVL